MRIYDIINKKRYGKKLNSDEIHYFINAYCNNKIEDYQASALLMAICINGMDDEEVLELTKAMLDTGDRLDFSSVGSFVVDKHSTGGVGDKTTIILLPLLASLDIKMAKMSGKGLGHTGGTIDKFSAINGFSTDIGFDKFIENIKDVGACVVKQSDNLVRADKKLYSLRDVTATVESIPLISSSIMSKKLALGSDALVLDVTVGNGAFMKNLEDAKKLSKVMVNIGKGFGKKCVALITDMNQPLGHNIGNSLEVIEAIEFMKGKRCKDLEEVTVSIASELVSMAKSVDIKVAKQIVDENLKNGKCLDKFREIIISQGGDDSCIDDYSKFGEAKYKKEIFADDSGYVESINAYEIGEVCVSLGAGRTKLEDVLDLNAGIILDKKVGDKVNSGDRLMTLYSSKKIDELLNPIFKFTKDKPQNIKHIYDRISNDAK